MRAIFIADAHLRHEGDENYRLLVEFLTELRGTVDTLFILGDLFEFWIGYETVPFTHYLPILKKLQELAENGTEIVYLEGNHDFHMGPFFTKTLGARVHPGPALVTIEGKQVYLCHGDEVNSRDYSYRLLRFILHSSLVRAATRVVPPSVASRIAERMSRGSRKNHGRRQHRWDYPALLREFAARRFREGCDVVVSGHFHIPFLDEADGKVLLSLGDWLTHYTYGEWRDGVVSLRRYRYRGPGTGDQ
ncbi:metallophosphoesterase [Geobacter metallireducens RCH3]|uniref:UDP-N-2, O-3-di-(3-hydroxyacyl)glucosamine/UDP-N-2, N-3-di-(3-hydroxyacyl)glucosediamine pyrophosphatase n=1 Tax=Geobacter metallireducens (strain ATCC 53774 / DSM 7210 / GS-15) TaxID=269799 RepID=Q39RY0_GEOMG|nr:UDP-2,3-diacylglucosamine diphosphatase [Geobacter metallireducens]ABB32994.1 UDP-N-2,O-3-di-(3-hydroxyacyl)glucosamine/UDP-N-2,N-3-di-(3-hydroxyacyl)glucosediamine pyrophosphatase [Geobacter metallireducens GS-15]EHP88872.1 metallophosphoesterase [Geobacter metallireducens RCH3]